jgi:Rod binding domain-containing protein
MECRADQQFAQLLADSGGLGLADMIAKEQQSRRGPADRPNLSTEAGNEHPT